MLFVVYSRGSGVTANTSYVKLCVNLHLVGYFSRVLILEVQIRFAVTLKSKSNDVQHFRNTKAS